MNYPKNYIVSTYQKGKKAYFISNILNMYTVFIIAFLVFEVYSFFIEKHKDLFWSNLLAFIIVSTLFILFSMVLIYPRRWKQIEESYKTIKK